MEFDLFFVPIAKVQAEIKKLVEETTQIISFFEEQAKIESDYATNLTQLPQIEAFPKLTTLNTSLIKNHGLLATGLEDNIIPSLSKWRDDCINSNAIIITDILQLTDAYELGLSTLENLKKIQHKEALLVDQLEGKERETKFQEVSTLTKQYKVIHTQVAKYEANYLVQKRGCLKLLITNWQQTYELIDMSFKYYNNLLRAYVNFSDVEIVGQPAYKIWTFIEGNKGYVHKEALFEPLVPKFDRSNSFAFEKILFPVFIHEDYFSDRTNTENLAEFYIEYLLEVFAEKKFDSQKTKKAKELLNQPEGRRGFAMALNQLRGSPQLSPQHFKFVGDLMYAALSKSQNDTGVCRIMFNMCQTYYRQSEDTSPQYLTHYLKNHSIWKNLEFWDQMIMDAIEDEKTHHENPSIETVRNIVFGQLSGYAFNMLCMAIPIRSVSQFVDKYCTKYTLSQEYRNLVKSTVDSSGLLLIKEKL
jgi:hypothetical protein